MVFILPGCDFIALNKFSVPRTLTSIYSLSEYMDCPVPVKAAKCNTASTSFRDFFTILESLMSPSYMLAYRFAN